VGNVFAAHPLGAVYWASIDKLTFVSLFGQGMMTALGVALIAEGLVMRVTGVLVSAALTTEQTKLAPRTNETANSVLVNMTGISLQLR
jgi:hypothetical protein